jgi:hypothetical protein
MKKSDFPIWAWSPGTPSSRSNYDANQFLPNFIAAFTTEALVEIATFHEKGTAWRALQATRQYVWIEPIHAQFSQQEDNENDYPQA